MNIKTKHTSNKSGAGQVKATGAGKQRTIPWDHSVSIERNHGAAAGTLAVALGLTYSPSITHTANADGSHTFAFPS